MDEGSILQEAAGNLPCDLELSGYNEAVSLQARLKRYIIKTNEMYKGRESPFEGLEISVVKPNILRFERKEVPTLRPSPRLRAVPDPE